eukprot:m.246944 g.246944  ORF g.246944 m.246944 type:complete len:151 (+) comp54478_c2_seq1:89-541(+)
MMMGQEMDMHAQQEMGHNGQEDENVLREQDRFLPIASVGRIMKSVLPDNVKISKEAKETMQELASEFVCFIASEASDRCQVEKRKVIVGTDIVNSLQELGFESYAMPIRIFYDKYRMALKMSVHEETKSGIRMLPGQAPGLVPGGLHLMQ